MSKNIVIKHSKFVELKLNSYKVSQTRCKFMTIFNFIEQHKLS